VIAAVKKDSEEKGMEDVQIKTKYVHNSPAE
jgi:hypothetical protein